MDDIVYNIMIDSIDNGILASLLAYYLLNKLLKLIILLGKFK